MASSMNQTTTRLTRIIEVLNTLKPHSPIALSELAALVNSDATTLRRDLNVLANCEIDMFYIDISIDDEDVVTLHRLPFTINRRVSFSEDEALAVSLALSMAGADEDEEIVTKLRASLLGTQHENLLAQHVHPMTPNHSFEVFEAVSLAAQLGFAIEFMYETNEGVIARRRADVGRITSEREGWYFQGYDHDRKQIRTFKLSHMSQPTILYFEKSLGKNNRDVADNVIESLEHKIQEGAEEVATIVFATRQAFVARDWPLALRTRQLAGAAGGGYRVDIPCINRDYIARKVISLGGLATVTHPASLREHVRQKALDLARAYEESPETER